MDFFKHQVWKQCHYLTFPFDRWLESKICLVQTLPHNIFGTSTTGKAIKENSNVLKYEKEYSFFHPKSQLEHYYCSLLDHLSESSLFDYLVHRNSWYLLDKLCMDISNHWNEKNLSVFNDRYSYLSCLRKVKKAVMLSFCVLSYQAAALFLFSQA